MSWSVSAMGKGEAVGRSLKDQFSRIPAMVQPEQDIKNKVAEIVDAACSSALTSGFIIRAEGHQYSLNEIPQSMHLKVEIDLINFYE
jgi:hypothetical protein